MKTFLRSLISSLSLLLLAMVDAAMLHTGSIKYAINKDPNTSNLKGRIGNWVFTPRLGSKIVKGRPTHFNITDPSRWHNRWDKFRGYFTLARCFIGVNLATIYQGKPTIRTYFNSLCSELSKFWPVVGEVHHWSPSTVEVIIGNGTMPDARSVVLSSSVSHTLNVSWDENLIYPSEADTDLVQCIIIASDGSFAMLADGAGRARSDGSASFAVPSPIMNLSTHDCYAAIDFISIASAELSGKVKGRFKFPIGMTPTVITT